MGCEIVTGKKVIGVSNKGSAEDRSATVLFDRNSTTQISHVVTVGDCKALKLSTFNLKDGQAIELHRVLIGGGVMAQGSGCCCDADPASPADVLASEPFKIDCKPVVLTHCFSVLFLTVPGTYMFKLNDEGMVGNVLAFAESVECCCLPSGLIIGNKAHDDYIGVA